MIGWVLGNPAGFYLIGAGCVLIGGALGWHISHEWRRVLARRRWSLAQARRMRAQARRWAIAQQQARMPHPSHRGVRVLRPVVRASAPRPRPATEPCALPGLGSARMLLPVVSRAEEIPGQRGDAR